MSTGRARNYQIISNLAKKVKFYKLDNDLDEEILFEANN